MMRERVRSPLLHHGPEYSMSYQQGNLRDCRYPPRDGYEYSPSYRRSPNNRRDPRYSLPRGLRDRGSRFSHGSSSGYGELERSRWGAGDVSEPRERRDYGRDLDGGRGRQLVELARYNEDLGRGDTASMKFQWDHLSNHSERVNVEAGLGTVNPNVSMEGTDYRTHIDEDRDKQSSKMSNPNEGLPPRDLQYAMFQGKHVLGKGERIASDSSHNPKYFLEYGRSRNHHDSRFEGLGSSRMIMEKPIYPKTDLKISTYIPRSSNKRSYPDVGAGGSNVPTKKISVGLHQDEKIRLHDDLSHEKLYGDRSQSYINERGIPRFSLKDETTRMYSREEKNPRYYLREEKLYSSYGEKESQFSLKDTLPHEIPLSQYKGSTADPFGCSIIDLCCSNKDSLPVGSDAYGRSSGYPTEPLPVKNSNSVMEDASNYMKDNKLSPNVGTHIDYSYSTAWRSDYTEINPLLDKPYEKLSISKDDNRHIDPLGSRIMDPILDGYSSRGEHLAEERLRDALCSPLGRIVPSYLDAPGSSYAIGSVEGLGRGEIGLGYGDIYQDHENKSSREDYGYGQDEGLQPHDEKTSSYLRDYYSYGQDAGLQEESAEKRANSYTLKDYDHVYDRIDHVFDGDYCDPLEGTNIKDVGVLTQPKDVFTRRRAIRDRICINRNISSKARGSRPNKSLFGGPRYRNPCVYNGIVQPRQYKAFESEGGSAGKERALNPRVRDIKKRLGPARPVGRIVAKPLVKKQKNWKVSRKNEDDDGEGSVQAEKEGPPEHGAETAKSEPPEKSEEFKQLVRSAFFKFIRQLNENLVELKKFKGQGKSGSLRCWVCGSDSEEFTDTESLVKHACTATKVGFRAPHLGFHKALCALMGWKAAEIHNNEWVCEVLSVAEIAHLKKDLILWPPLVVIHNCSIEKSNRDGQMVVSVEALETMIEGLGFGEKTKVCRGKPVNQSVMVVKFGATYSGFQQAEKLHKFFADNKHGRTEFLKIKSKGPIDGEDRQKASTNNMHDVLYGFLGIARDLHKLDSEAKKRSVVRSRKEIQDLGDEPLKAKQK